MPEATRATGDNQQREDNRSFFEKYGGTIFQMVAMWMVSRYLFGGGGKYTHDSLRRIIATLGAKPSV
jgi:hypothetical protein